MMNDMTFLFMTESYKDIYKEYIKIMNSQQENKIWDYIVLTASNEFQAKGYKAQINSRKEKNLLPKNIEYLIISDRENKRVGNGGSTLEVLKYIAEKEKTTNFSNLKIAIIHNGGDSKRIPQYSSLGKVFSPMPRRINYDHTSTLFDELFFLILSIGARMNEGLICLSGDTLLICNPLQISFNNYDAAVIGFKENKDKGVKHGVFVKGENFELEYFLHKQPIPVLEKHNAIYKSGRVNIDTGLCMF